MGELDLSLKKGFVKSQACFSKLTEEEMEKLAQLLVEKYFAAGETIVTEGDLVDSVYLIVSGTADVRHDSIIDDKLHSRSVAKLGKGETIGLNETGFYSLSGRRTATVVAETNMVLLCLSTAEFHGFALAYSHVNEVMRKNAEAVLGSNK
jgi:signal-transduction protein with cAMP-binding, CBS, and nucleotidyltransferase domain